MCPDHGAVAERGDPRPNELGGNEPHRRVRLRGRQRALGGHVHPGNHRQLVGGEGADETLRAVRVRVDHTGQDDGTWPPDGLSRRIRAENLFSWTDRDDVPARDGDRSVEDDVAGPVQRHHASEHDGIDGAARGTRRGGAHGAGF